MRHARAGGSRWPERNAHEEEGGPLPREELARQVGESGPALDAAGPAIAGGARQLVQPHPVRDGRLPSGRGMDSVVEADVKKIRRGRGCDRGERTRVHEHVAIAIEDEHPPRGLGEGESEPNRSCQAHRADHVEAFRAVAGRAPCARDVTVRVHAELVAEMRHELSERLAERHAKSPGRTTSAAGAAVARTRSAAHSASASTLASPSVR